MTQTKNGSRNKRLPFFFFFMCFAHRPVVERHARDA
jgi:hypothetical protein